MSRLAVGLLTATLFSCSAGGGPLDHDYSASEVCVRTDASGTATIGIDALVNPGPENVEIQSVSLKGGSSLTMLQAVVVPAGSNLVGVLSGFPPDPATLDQGIRWVEASDAAGAVIPPDTDTAAWNLVVGLQLDDDSQSGTTDGFEVVYDYGGRTYTYVTPSTVELVRESCS